MMAAAVFRRFAFGYGAAFAVLYAVSRARGLALFTVYPTLGIILPGMHRSRDVADPVLDFLAPEMWWFGWTATAAIGALVFGLAAALSPDQWWRRFWPEWWWVIAVFAMVACAYLNVPWLRR